MKKTSLFFSLLLLFLYSHAQETWVDIADTKSAEAANQAQKLFDEKDYTSALVKYKDAIAWAPQIPAYHSMVATCYYYLKDYAKAHPYFRESFLLEPGNVSYVLDLILSMVLNNATLEDVKPLLAHFAQLSAFPSLKEQSIEIIEELPLEANKTIHKEIVEWYQNKIKATPAIAEGVFSRIGKAIDYVKEGKIKLLEQIMNEMGVKMDSLKNPYNFIAADIYSVISRELALFGYLSESKIYAEKCLKETEAYPSFTSNQASIATVVLSQYYRQNGNYEAALQQLVLWKNKYSTHPVSGYTRFEVMKLYPFLYANLKQFKDAVLSAQGLSSLVMGYKGPYYAIETNEAFMKAYVKGPTQVEVQKAIIYGNNALSLAKEANYVGLIPGIQSNIAYAYYNSGNTDAAIKQYEELIKLYEQRQKPGDIELTLNNIGGLLWQQKRYKELVPILERTIGIQNKIIQSVSNDMRLYYFQNTVSPYIWLGAAHALNKNIEASILAIEKSRGRVLAEKLGAKMYNPPATLAELQKGISSKELIIYYTEIEPGKILIQTLSSTDATAVVHDFSNALRSIKLQYQPYLGVIAEIESQKRMRKNTYYNTKVQYIPRDPLVMAYIGEAAPFQKEDFSLFIELFRYCLAPPDAETGKALAGRLTPFSKLLYNTLISPIVASLNSKELLTILPDGALNFIPFETLMTASGTYLGEQYNIRYGSSVRVLQQLEQRIYDETRKPVLAMGGAYYDEMQIKAPPIQKEEELAELSELTMKNKLSNKSQRYVLARLGYGKMDYLIGTLNEVNAIKKVVPEAVLYTGEQMTEQQLKKLSASGELAKYKVLHLATHGWSNNIIPSLSGVAMCILPTEKEGEDGYLFTYEMANLKLKADMVMLSACETGLGKLYNGEGVVGLTQALLTAGANSTLVSLWPVNDYSTSVLVSETYRLVFKENMTYRDALWTVKKKMIKGDYNRSGMDLSKPEYWSPFVFYGK